MIEFLQLSLVPLLSGILAGITCALLGTFLLLRRQSLMGDALSHVALPGIVGAFIVTGSLGASAMLAGAGIAALVAVLLIEAVRRFGRVESGAAMGVVFTALFATGVLWLELSGSRGIHLDVEHVLYGNLESLIWLTPMHWQDIFDPDHLATLPPALPRLALALAVVAAGLALGRRPLLLATFDPAYAASVGARPTLTGLVLLGGVALAAVSAFSAVGAILVVAMFIGPAAAARLCTNRLGVQLALASGFAVSAAVLGFILAAYGPLWLGNPHSVSAAGMMAVVIGLQVALAALWGPRRRG